MAIRKDATLTRYEAGGYCLRLPDGSEYETDTPSEALTFAAEEGCARVYLAQKPGHYVLVGTPDDPYMGTWQELGKAEKESRP